MALKGYLVTKTEESEVLITRQIKFLESQKIETEQIDSWSYKYRYVYGQILHNPVLLYRFLEDNVWNQQPFSFDLREHEAYANYICSLAHNLELSVVDGLHAAIVEMCLEPKVLVHGDSTLENFIERPTGEIVPIDPGLPRGFNTKENDIGKILQHCLTYWSYWKRFEDPDRSIYRVKYLARLNVVTGYSILSLYTHWIRILKNATRHSPDVTQYGSHVVIPLLSRELAEDIQSGTLRHRWNAYRLQGLCHELLPTSH